MGSGIGLAPHTWVVGLEAQDNVAVGIDDEGVAAHGGAGEILLGDAGILPDTGLLLGAVDGLEGVAVEMEGMAARVEVVDDELDDLVLLQDKGVGVGTVDGRVRGIVASGEGRVKRGDIGGPVGDVVEEGIVLAVVEVVHHDVELNDAIRLAEKFHLVVGNQRHIVERV